MRLAQGGYRLLELPLLKIDQAQIRMHLSHSGLQLTELLKCLFGLGVTALGKRALPFLGISLQCAGI